MKSRPTIFLSGVSSEFGSFRDAVENEIQKKGCFAENQSSFGVDYRTVEALLRQKLKEADAVVHIVGFRFGAEPTGRPTDKPRRSYTQMEFDIAREMEKPVYLFVSSDASVRDAPKPDEKPEDADVAALQLAHREAILKSDHQYFFFKDKDELCRLAAEIPQVITFDLRADISRIVRYAPAELVGREEELELLNDAWLKVRRAESQRPHILSFVALGGEGKTSLVAKWAAELAHHGWPGCDAAFAWSFYSQGTREQYAASSDLFLKEAITFFGDEADAEFAASSAGAYEKGQRLARIVSQRRSLLILDGLEPLQYAPTSPSPGELKDAGLAALLKRLAADNDGLCIITTRHSLPDLKAFWQTTAPEVKLLRLSREAGVHLLKTLGVKGTTKEFESLVENVKGHALTLNLLGGFLRRAFQGDIRKRDRVNFEKADEKIDGGHAFRTMAAYEQWLLSGGEEGRREVTILRLLGLFDRPADFGCVESLRQAPVIAGLTEPLENVTEDDWNITLSSLSDCGLISIQSDRSALDSHPLLREYFAKQLRTQQGGTWRAAHKRLYDYLRSTVVDKEKPTLEDLQPLYHAVTHGCEAGLLQETFDEIYVNRIIREREFYTTRKLGAFASDLGAVTCFFETPWSHVSPTLSEVARTSLLNLASVRLRALGRLTEAVELTRAAVKGAIKQKVWEAVARNASNLSELQLTLGQVANAITDAEQSVGYGDLSKQTEMRLITRSTHAYALHEAGRRAEAEMRFRQTEQMNSEFLPAYPLLHSLMGFEYCELLLTDYEYTAWQRTLKFSGGNKCPSIEALRAVSQRATQTLKWSEEFAGAALLDLAANYLTLGRAALYDAVLSETDLLNTENSKPKTLLNSAVNGLRRAGTTHYLPNGLLTRAWLRLLTNSRTGPDSAQEDLDEAWEIAERGPMRLHMADIHLYRARLFFREEKYPWGSAREDLAAARKLIEQCGYWRRKEELEDAEQVILSQS